MLTRFIINYYFSKDNNWLRKFLPSFGIFLTQALFKMNPVFPRKFTISVFSNILYRNPIFHSLPKTTAIPPQNRKLVLFIGPSHPQYSTCLASRSPPSIYARISNGFMSVFVGYLSVKLTFGICNELATYIAATGRLYKRTVSLRFQQTDGTVTKIYGNYIVAKWIVILQKAWSIFPNAFYQVKSSPPNFTSSEIQNNNVNGNTNSSKQQIVNSNNNNNKSINSPFFIYYPKITGRLFSIQNRPLILPRINPNSYTIPRSNPIHRNNHISIYPHVIPSTPTHKEHYTQKECVDGTLEHSLKSMVGRGVQQRKLGNFQDARRLFEFAAVNKNAEGLFNLGLMYFSGEGGEKNYLKALLNMESASNLGNEKARIVLSSYRLKENLKRNL